MPIPIRRAAVPLVLLLLLPAACAEPTRTPPVDGTPPPGACVVAERAPAPEPDLEPAFARAARETGVPEALLKAVGWAETRWQMVRGTGEGGRAAAYGVMGLRGAALERGAALAGLPVEAVRSDPGANVRAAAALLLEGAREAGRRPVSLEDWAPVVAAYSGIADPGARAAYVRDGVYRALARGASTAAVTLRPVAVRLAEDGPRRAAAAGQTDFAGAVWRPSPNHDARMAGAGGRVMMVVVHTCEGNYAGCWGWLVNPESEVSAHYVVSEDGSEVSQLVREADRAWHIGARYDCSLDVGAECALDGVQSNHFTVGIEHAGFASQSSWPAAQLDASARLVCDVARRNGVTRDNLHVVAHGQLQPENRTDPGPYWPWADYLALVDRHCGGRDPGAALVVDDDDAANDHARARAVIPAGWTVSGATPGHWGGSYAFAAAAGTAPAAFWFHADAAGPHTLAAWWTAGSNRSTAVAFSVFDPDGGRIGRATADQSRSGTRWVTLGTWELPAGWSRLEVAPGGGCVSIADAVVVN